MVYGLIETSNNKLQKDSRYSEKNILSPFSYPRLQALPSPQWKMKNREEEPGINLHMILQHDTFALTIKPQVKTAKYSQVRRLSLQLVFCCVRALKSGLILFCTPECSTNQLKSSFIISWYYQFFFKTRSCISNVLHIYLVILLRHIHLSRGQVSPMQSQLTCINIAVWVSHGYITASRLLQLLLWCCHTAISCVNQ